MDSNGLAVGLTVTLLVGNLVGVLDWLLMAFLLNMFLTLWSTGVSGTSKMRMSSFSITLVIAVSIAVSNFMSNN